MGPLGRAKFYANQCPGVGILPQNGKNFHFLVKSRQAGANQLLGAFIRPTVLH